VLFGTLVSARWRSKEAGLEGKWWTLIAVCTSTFMLLLDITVVNVALPSIQLSLHASFTDLQWVVDAYALTLAALLLTCGAVADIVGRRLVFVLGLVVFTASSLLSGLASTPLWLDLARGAQGVGGAAMFATGLALLGDAFRGRERGIAFGVWGSITGLAAAVGPLVGGGLVTGISWRWIFLINVPIGILVIAGALLRVNESRQSGRRRIDVVGAATFSGALATLVYALIKGEASGWTSAPILGCLVGSAVLLVAFVLVERALGERALFDLSLFRNSTFAGGLIAAFAFAAGLFAMFLYLTLYIQDVLGYSALGTGLRLLVFSGGVFVTSGIAGRLTSRVQIRLLIAFGLTLIGIGLLLMRDLGPGSSWTALIPGFIVAGAGAGFVNPPLASTAIGVVEPARAGMASGINATFRQVGIATGIAGLGAIFTHVLSTHIIAALRTTHGISLAQAQHLAASTAQGAGVRSGLLSLAPGVRATAAAAVRASFVSGLDSLFLIGAIISLAAAAGSMVLIRQRDFSAAAAHAPVAA
jgi:EmrB/QacA subfamily drug resistance transporter